MKRLTDHLIVISFDCLSSLDFPSIEKLPHFKELLSRSSFCKNVSTIYPSVTYPCHTSIITGNYPNRHGIVTNTLLQPGKKSPDWYWQRKHIKGTTLYDEAKAAGMTTAALLWPVTGKAKIDYNMPEIFANRLWHFQVPVSLMNGSPFYLLEMNKRFGHLRNGIRQPELDDFVTASAVHTIQTKKPDLLLMHLVDLDWQRHHHGFDSKEARAAIVRHDRRLGEIITALKDSGIYQQSTIIVLGDHSALDESHAVNMNVLLKENGLIRVDKNGKVKSWLAYCKSNDGSAYIYVKNDDDTAIKNKLEALLHSLVRNKKNGVERVLKGFEADQLGADGQAAFMLEARKGFYFTEHVNRIFIEQIGKEDVKAGHYTFAAHGYSPQKENYETVFIASGKGVKKGIEITSMNLVDEGPTFAQLLGLSLGETDGKVVNQLIDSTKF